MAGKIIAPISIMAGTISLVVESRCICPSEKGQTLNRLHHPAGVSARWTVDLHDSACSVSGFVSASFPLSSCANCGSKRSSHGPGRCKDLLRGARDAQNGLGRQTIPGSLFSLVLPHSRGDQKKVGSEKGPANRRISPKSGIPQTTSAGLCLGSSPLASSPPHTNAYCRTTPSRRAREKSGQFSPMVAALDPTRLHRSELRTLGVHFVVHSRES